MTVCLMFPDEKEKESVFGLSERTLRDLSMDRFPDLIGLDAAQKAAFLGAVRSPSTSVETVIFRQEILNDFLNNPDLSGRLCDICSGMLSDISLLGSDLEFYVSAVKFAEFLKERGIPVCFPRVSGVSRGISASGLSDTFLALGGDSKPVPNDVSLSGKGVLIYGENGSGKTVFLRSLATARILFQCGLPVPAETAEFPVAARICAVFAEAENKDYGGTGSGRFETEVKAVADAIGTLTPGSAVFFNEVFQSTEYREASEGFADILSYLTDTGVQWTAVTHLDELKDCLPEGSADILTTITGFRVISVL